MSVRDFFFLHCLLNELIFHGCFELTHSCTSPALSRLNSSLDRVVRFLAHRLLFVVAHPSLPWAPGGHTTGCDIFVIFSPAPVSSLCVSRRLAKVRCKLRRLSSFLSPVLSPRWWFSHSFLINLLLPCLTSLHPVDMMGPLTVL